MLYLFIYNVKIRNRDNCNKFLRRVESVQNFRNIIFLALFFWIWWAEEHQKNRHPLRIRQILHVESKYATV